MSISAEIVQLVGNLILVPIAGVIWNVNTRLSKMEGHLDSFQKEMRHNHDENIRRIERSENATRR